MSHAGHLGSVVNDATLIYAANRVLCHILSHVVLDETAWAHDLRLNHTACGSIHSGCVYLILSWSTNDHDHSLDLDLSWYPKDI